MSVFADIQVPQISQDELFAFHESHFANVSVADFGVSFIGLQVPPAPVQTSPVEGIEEEYYEEYEYEEGEEEGFGDYDEPLDPSVAHLVLDFDFADAVEVEDTKPAIETTRSQNIDYTENHENHENHDDKEEDAEDGEVPEEGDGPKPKKKKRRRKKNGAGNKTGGSNGSSNDNAHQKADRHDKYTRQERQGRPHKPDLRKRTWDIVDKGLGSLDYDDTEADPGSMPAPPQRRRIQYED